jgi:hypothetical protein
MVATTVLRSAWGESGPDQAEVVRLGCAQQALVAYLDTLAIPVCAAT